MTVELTRQQIDYIGMMAKSPELASVVEAMKSNYKDQWAATRPDDTKGRDHYYSMVTVCDAFIAELKNIASSDAKIIYHQTIRNQLNGSYTRQAKVAPERG